MGRTGRKLLTRLTISMIVALAAPALAAVLVAGMSAAAAAGDQALGPIYPYATSATSEINSDSSPFIAPRNPASPGVVAGVDDAAR